MDPKTRDALLNKLVDLMPERDHERLYPRAFRFGLLHARLEIREGRLLCHEDVNMRHGVWPLGQSARPRRSPATLSDLTVRCPRGSSHELKQPLSSPSGSSVALPHRTGPDFGSGTTARSSSAKLHPV